MLLALVALPDEARLLVLSLITAGLTWVLLVLSAKLGIDLSGYAQPIAAVLAPIVITVVESYLQLIPPVFDDVVLAVIHLLVLLLGSLGSFVVYSLVRRPKAFTLR